MINRSSRRSGTQGRKQQAESHLATMGYWRRFQRERISRRRLLGAAGVGVVGLAAVGLSGSGPEIAASGTEPARGGRYQDATQADWGTLDPLVSIGGGPTIFPRLYNVLANRSSRSPDFWFLDLAEEFEMPDDETYIFSVRPNVTIAPNDLNIPERNMDSLDAMAWLNRVTQDQYALLQLFADEWVSSFQAPSLGTFVVRTKGPYGYFFFRIGAPLGGTIPPREFYEQGIGLRDQGVGAGPFVLRPGSYQETGGLILDRNPNYYRRDPADSSAQLPYVDGMDFVRITDRFAWLAAFMDQRIYAYGAQSGDEVAALLDVLPDLQVAEHPANTFISFVMNPTRSPWHDERIRKAALFALNRQQFVDLIVGPGGGQPNGLVHWPLEDFALPPEELAQLQPYDPQRSRALIQEATGQSTIAIDLIYPVGVDIQFIDQHLSIFLLQMRDAGFDIQESPMDFGTWLARYSNVDYDASLSVNQIYETAEIPLDWHSSQGPAGNGSFALGVGVLFPEVDNAILDSKAAVDPAEHINRVHDTQRLIYDKGPAFLPIMSWISYVVRHGFVRNWPQGLGNTELFLNDWWLSFGPGGCPDVNGDGQVSLPDLALVAEHWRHDTAPPNDGLDQTLDLNKDGTVSLGDLAQVALHWGESCPGQP